MSTFLHWALYGTAVFFGIGVLGIAAMAARADRDGHRGLAWLFACYGALAVGIITVLVLAAGDLR